MKVRPPVLVTGCQRSGNTWLGKMLAAGPGTREVYQPFNGSVLRRAEATRWPFRDHCPPLSGGIRFDELVPLLPKKCAMVLEMSPRTEAADIVNAAEAWAKRFT